MKLVWEAEYTTLVLFPVLQKEHGLLDCTLRYESVILSTSTCVQKEALVQLLCEHIILSQMHAHTLMIVVKLDHMGAVVMRNVSRILIQANGLPEVSQFK